jgi:hypothetical protein
MDSENTQSLLRKAPPCYPFLVSEPSTPRKYEIYAGSRNRASVVVAALVEGECEELMRKALQVAMAGDVVMLKFLLGRLMPRERPIRLELPTMEFADDAVEAHAAIVRAVSDGLISPSEAAALAALMTSYGRAIDMADVVKRLDALEAQIRGRPRS